MPGSCQRSGTVRNFRAWPFRISLAVVGKSWEAAALRCNVMRTRACWIALRYLATVSWGPEAPSKIQEVTLMRPFHGNL